MGREIPAVFSLRCKHCGYQMPNDATLESYALHMQVEHDTDEVHLQLSVICTCGAAMPVERERPMGAKTRITHRCEHDGNYAIVIQGKGGQR